MKNRIEISLTEVNNLPVSLNKLSFEALESFMSVVSSLKSIVSTIDNTEEITFSISEGSALCAIDGPETKMEIIYSKMDNAIKGKSKDSKVTSQLRIIQNQIKDESFKYNFKYFKNDNVINIKERIVEARKISKKRERCPYSFKIVVLKGFLNQIGGKDPNYHFDYGGGNKITISCSMNDAIKINKYLYKTIDCIVLCKESSDSKYKEYWHKELLEEKDVKEIKEFFISYNKEKELLNKLLKIHDFFDEVTIKSERKFELINILVNAFNDINLHLSELKTILVVSKPFKEHVLIKNNREALYKTYIKKKDNA